MPSVPESASAPGGDDSPTERTAGSGAAGGGRRWPAWAKVVASGLIVGHLTAVVLPPLSFSASGSPLLTPLVRLVRPYTDATALTQGYAFFAPEPPQGTILRYRVTFADGRTPVAGTIPDVRRRFPRLWYHRHFMLADQLHGDFVPPRAGPLPPQAEAAYDLQRRRYESKRDAFAAHLARVHGGDAATITRVVHHVRAWEDFRAGLTARDGRLYEVLSDDGPPPGMVPLGAPPQPTGAGVLRPDGVGPGGFGPGVPPFGAGQGGPSFGPDGLPSGLGRGVPFRAPAAGEVPR